MILVILIVYCKLELKPVNSRRNINGYLINTIINILIEYVVIDIVEDVTGLNTTLVVTVLCIHCTGVALPARQRQVKTNSGELKL